jgi:hypothetical protein
VTGAADELARRLEARKVGREWVALCPLHADTKPSLNWRDGDSGGTVFVCRAGCDSGELLAYFRRKHPDLFGAGNGRPEEQAWEICDTEGRVVATHARYHRDGSKRYAWRLPDGTRGLGGRRVADLPLYGTELLRGWTDGLLYVCEGEKAADAGRRLGLQVLGTVCGASSCPSDGVLRVLAGRDVAVCPDLDRPGLAHAERLVSGLRRIGAARVRTLPPWPGMGQGYDLADYRGTVEDLLALLDGAAPPEADPPEPEPWDPPVPLDHVRELDALPAGALPPWLAAMAEGLAHQYQVPLELPAMYALALLSGATAGRYVVRVRAGWRMPLVLYVVVGLPPSERKTPVITALAAPLRAWERERLDAIATQRQEALAAVRRAKAREEGALRALGRPAKGADVSELEAAHVAAARALAEAEAAVPPESYLLVEYATPEALAERMVDAGDRQVILSDEGAGVLAMTGRYSKRGGADLDLLLRGYDGLPYVPARITRRVRPMDAATLAIALGAQPVAIAEAVRQAPELRERGVLARMLTLIPSPRAGSRTVRAAPVEAHVAAEYGRRLRAVLDEPDRHDDDGRLSPRELRLSRDADDVIAALETWLEPQLGRGGRLERVASWAGKLAGAAARLAALLHVADHAGETVPVEVPVETALRAVAIARACVPHAEALEDVLSAPPELEAARRVLSWLQRHGRAVVTAREILRGTRGSVSLATAGQRDAALALLERHGYVRVVSIVSRGPGRPSPEWDVHPSLLGDPSPTPTPGDVPARETPPPGQYGQYGPDTGDEGDIVHTVQGSATPAPGNGTLAAAPSVKPPDRVPGEDDDDPEPTAAAEAQGVEADDEATPEERAGYAARAGAYREDLP